MSPRIQVNGYGYVAIQKHDVVYIHLNVDASLAVTVKDTRLDPENPTFCWSVVD